MNHKFYPGVHICKRNEFVNVIIGHLALSVRLKPRPGRQSNEVQEGGKELDNNKESEKTFSSPPSFQKHESTDTVEESDKNKQSNEDLSLGQSHEGLQLKKNTMNASSVGKLLLPSGP